MSIKISFSPLLLTLGLIVRALHAAVAAPVPGDHVAPFSLGAVHGGTITWKPGRTTVLSFCAFWCDTWKEQSRRLAVARQALHGLPVDYLMVSVDGRWSDKAHDKISTPVLLDLDGALTASLHVNSVPYTMVVDPRGRVVYAAQGIVRSAKLTDALREALGGHGPARSSVAPGTVYLTFDDFPSAGTGPDDDDQLLDTLRAAGVTATFFCIGRNVREHPAVVRRLVREGHVLQLHSWDHHRDDPQIAQCVRVLAGASGTAPTLYRPPGSSQLLRLHGTQIDGTVKTQVINPYDYTRPGEREIARRVLSAARPGTVILLHAGVSETIAVLPEIIATLQRRGLKFGVLR